jgi:TonB family protein
MLSTLTRVMATVVVMAAASIRPAATAGPQTAAPPSTRVPVETGFGAGAYRPGGGVLWPKDIRQSKPQYTDDALKQKIEGIVELEVVVLPDGTVGPVRIVKSLDTKYGLDNEAVRAARQWMFKPGQLNGTNVAVIVPMQLEFRSRTAAAATPKDVSRLRPLADEFAKGAYFVSSAGIGAPRPTREVRPTYTPEGLQAKIQGQVDLEMVVTPDGTVGKARIVRSLDTTYGLDEQALTAAKQWTFLPGTLDGKPVPVLIYITLEFKIRPMPQMRPARLSEGEQRLAEAAR